nr:hypothetical protein [Bacteriovorax sp.]
MFNRSLMASSLLLTLTLASCAPKHSGKGGFILSDYFSMRQQGVTPYVGLIQLQTRPLLADVQMLNGKAVIDEEAKKAIIAEQEEVIARLQELSADIKIISTYKLVLNAVAFVATSDLSEKISKIQGVTKVVENSNFARPKTVSLEKKLSDLEISLPVKGINEHNTVTFIGADKVHRAGISGQNMKIGIIDTGIDYTHSM